MILSLLWCVPFPIACSVRRAWATEPSALLVMTSRLMKCDQFNDKVIISFAGITAQKPPVFKISLIFYGKSYENNYFFASSSVVTFGYQLGFDLIFIINFTEGTSFESTLNNFTS